MNQGIITNQPATDDSRVALDGWSDEYKAHIEALIEAETPAKTYRMIVTIEDCARPRSEQIRYIPEDEVQARRDAIRQGMPQGTVYTIKVLDEN